MNQKKNDSSITAQDLLFYYETEAEEVPIFGSLREISLAENILNSVPSSFDSFIDIGCGDGYVLYYFKEKYHNKKLFGLDISEMRIRTTRANVPLSHLIRSDVHHLPFPDNSFDVVICSELLEHILDYKKTIEELTRISNRWIIITVPNELQPVPIMCPKCKTKHFLDGHVNYFTEKKLKSFFEGNKNLSIKRTKKFHSIYTYNRLSMRLPLFLRLIFDKTIQRFYPHISFFKPNFLLIVIEKKQGVR